MFSSISNRFRQLISILIIVAVIAVVSSALGTNTTGAVIALLTGIVKFFEQIFHAFFGSGINVGHFHL